MGLEMLQACARVLGYSAREKTQKGRTEAKSQSLDSAWKVGARPLLLGIRRGFLEEEVDDSNRYSCVP